MYLTENKPTRIIQRRKATEAQEKDITKSKSNIMSSSQPSPPCYWLDKSIVANDDDAAAAAEDVVDIDCICLGTGRFLRSVLVPIMVEYMNKNIPNNKNAVGPVLIQPRGISMIEYMSNKESQQANSYEIDTVLSNGTTETSQVPISAVFSLSSPQGKHSLVEYLPQIMKKRYVVHMLCPHFCILMFPSLDFVMLLPKGSENAHSSSSLLPSPP